MDGFVYVCVCLQDVETNQRDEYQNPTSAMMMETTTTTTTTASRDTTKTQTAEKAQETLENIQKENKQQQKQQELELTLKPDALGNSHNNIQQVDIVPTSESLSLNNLNSDENILLNINKTNINDTDKDKQMLKEQQSYTENLQQQKTIENNDEIDKHTILAKSNDHYKWPQNEDTQYEASAPTSTLTSSIENETMEIDLKPKMIDDETTNKMKTTQAANTFTSTSTTSHSSSPAEVTHEFGPTTVTNEMENNVHVKGVNNTKSHSLSHTSNSNISINSNTTATASSPTPPTNPSISTNVLLLPSTNIITQDNHNQSLNLTVNASSTSITTDLDSTNIKSSNSPNLTNT